MALKALTDSRENYQWGDWDFQEMRDIVEKEGPFKNGGITTSSIK